MVLSSLSLSNITDRNQTDLLRQSQISIEERTQAISQAVIEAAKGTMIAVRESRGSCQKQRNSAGSIKRKLANTERITLQLEGIMIKLNKFNNFKNEENTFLINSYIIESNEKIPIIMNWLQHEGCRFIKTLTDSEQESIKQALDYSCC